MEDAQITIQDVIGGSAPVALENFAKEKQTVSCECDTSQAV